MRSAGEAVLLRMSRHRRATQVGGGCRVGVQVRALIAAGASAQHRRRPDDRRVVCILQGRTGAGEVQMVVDPCLNSNLNTRKLLCQIHNMFKLKYKH